MTIKDPDQQQALQNARSLAVSLARLFEMAGEPGLAMKAAGLGSRAEEARIQALLAEVTHTEVS